MKEPRDTPSQPPALAVSSVAGVSCATLLWTLGDRLQATLVVKATLGLVPGSAARCVEPDEIVRQPRHHGDDLRRSLASAPELAPFLPSAGVVLTGHAHAGPRRSVPAMSVRVAVARERVLLDKTLHVFGDRVAPGESPAPFQSMPLLYERARPFRAVPNVVDPTDPGGVAGFGPICPAWSPRPAMALPEDADWGSFHGAPADQRIDYLQGDEWLVLDGLHPELARVQTRLPFIRAHARCEGPASRGGAPRELEMRGDMLVIDADRQVASLLWRGHVPIRDAADLSLIELVVGLERAGVVIWPAPPAQPIDETTVDAGSVARARVMPFVPGDPGEVCAGLSTGVPDDQDAFGGATTTMPALPLPLQTLPFGRAPEGESQAPPEPPLEPAPAAAAPVEVATGVRGVVLERLRSGEPLHGLDLSRADLSDLDLTGRSLTGCDLRGAKLERSVLARACLDDVRLAGACLADADVRGASLCRADLKRAVLARARFDGAVLDGADLTSAQGPSARFDGARGKGARFSRGVWDAASFEGARLADADFSEARLDRASFSSAALEDVNLGCAEGRQVRFDDAAMPRAKARGARLAEASLLRVDARASVWDKAALDGANLEGAGLREASLAGASCARAVFAGADLRGANLGRMQADGADLTSASLEEADLRLARLRNARLDHATLARAAGGRADLSDASLVRADLRCAVLRAIKLARADLSHARAEGADLRDADLTGACVAGFSRDVARLRGASIRDVVEVGRSIERRSGDET